MAALGALLFFGTACSQTAPHVDSAPPSFMRERITLTTRDGVEIVGDYSASPSPRGWALLVHMMPADRRSYDRFGEALVGEGIAALAIDLRGHGESIHTQDDRTLDYHQFTDAEHQGSREDVRAALAYLQAQGAKPERTILVGASIGANLALDALASNHKLAGAVALSPGLDYRGIKADALVSQLAATHAVYLAASREDEYSFITIRELARMMRDTQPTLSLTVKELIEAKHGTAMFDREPTFMREVVQWVVDTVSGEQSVSSP